MAWSRRFDDPVTLPDGRILRTLREAGDYIMALPGKPGNRRHGLPLRKRS